MEKREQFLMLKKLFFTVLLACVTFSSFAMTDAQLLKMLKDFERKGATQTDIVTELIKKGVTIQQIKRVEKTMMMKTDGTSEQKSETNSRIRPDTKQEAPRSEKNKQQGETESKEPLSDVPFIAENVDQIVEEEQIFGQNLFSNKQLNFEPRVNIPTPENYILGAGDEIYIDMWGNSEFTIQQEISPDGTIVVKDVGMIYLSGLSVTEASRRLKNSFSKVYSDLSSSSPGTFIKLTLGKTRSIQVNLMGEVVFPGTYTVSSFATIFHALYIAGGVSKIGTLRNIKVFRKGKLFYTLDVYQYLMKGDNSKDILLYDGDVILVGTFNDLVKIKGAVKRPMSYEMKEGESVEELLAFAGGFSSEAFTENVTLSRKGASDYQIYTLKENEYKTFELKNGDEITVPFILQEFTNRVEVTGAVFREGEYSLDEKINSVKTLIEVAGGVKGDAYLDRVLLYRQEKDLSVSVESFNLAHLLSGVIPDIPLRKNDILFISSITQKSADYHIQIRGAVLHPDIYPFRANMTVQDIILTAGGLLESASLARVDVYRRIKETASNKEAQKTAEFFSFSILDEQLSNDGKTFILEPYDEIFVFHAPGYEKQANVRIEGEVLFPGVYAKLDKNERISSLLKRSGGVLSTGYLRGCRLIRKMTEEESVRIAALEKINSKSFVMIDSLAIDENALREEYTIAVDLKKIQKAEGTSEDLILREGDRLIVPTYNGTVKVTGAVSAQGVVVPYVKDNPISYYINASGGYDYHAARCRKYIVYMNGGIAKLRRASQIKPGSEIVVPTKHEPKNLTVGERVAVSSAVVSMTAVVASVVIAITRK